MTIGQESLSKEIKIFFFLSNLSGGGAQRTMVNLVRSIDKSLFLPTLVLLDYDSNDAYASLIPEDIEIINLNSRARYAALKIKKIIEVKQPDILFSTLPQVNFAVWLGNRISQKKSKLVLRETNYRKKGVNTTVFLQMIYRKIYRDADGIIGLSDGVTEHMIRNYRLDPLKVKRIYNPVDIEGIRELSQEKCEIIYNKDFKIIACGRLVKQKNYPVLIKALYLLKQKGCMNFELFIMGEGQEKKVLETMISDYGLDDYIKLIGFQQNPFAYMRQADLFILSSSWEGFGHVIVEAMACSTSVVSTDCPSGPNEIITHEINGLLCDLENAEDLTRKILLVLRNDELRQRLAKEGYKRSKDFDFKKIVREYENFFLTILNNKICN